MAKRTKFVYDADGVAFTIYRVEKPTKAGPKTYWLLEDSSTGKRRTLNNVSKEAAERRADQIRAAMVKGQAHRMLLSNGQWQDVCMAVEVLRNAPTADSLYTAIRSWLECIHLLDGKAALFDAVKFYVENHRGNGPKPIRIRFDEAAKLYHAFKVADGKSASHCDNIRSRLSRLATKLPVGVMLDELTAGQLEYAVVNLGLRPKTRNEYKITLGNLFTWAAKQNPPLVPKGFNPGKEMERYKIKHGEVKFLRVPELTQILTSLPAKRPDLLPLVVLVCFAGLRPSEAARLEWNEVGDDYIRLPGYKSKTGHPRQIPIQPNLKLWLGLWRKDSGLVCPDVSLEHVNTAIRRHSGVRLSHDAMRHGYGTHRQRVVNNVGQVAEEMGHSMAICRRHYLNAFCTDAEATAWFSLVPQKPATVIELSNSLPEATGLDSAASAEH